MGYDDHYTSACTKDNPEASEAQIVRASLIGNSFSIPVVSFLCDFAFLQRGFVGERLAHEDHLEAGVCAKPFTSEPVFVEHGCGDTLVSRKLVKAYLPVAEKGGTDVRIDINLPFRARAWPRAGVEPRLWTWKVIRSYRWARGIDSHINALECKAIVDTLKWKLRKSRGGAFRWLHLTDSQVCASILTKGRSSSGRLRASVRRFNALVLAGGVYPLVAFVHSEENPGDLPSRKLWRGRRSTHRPPHKPIVKDSA